MREEVRDNNFQSRSTASLVTVQRITAVWGFTESALGGVLHILQFPFTGLFIGSFAVLCIFLIAHYGKKPAFILRSTMVVILIKAVTVFSANAPSRLS